MDSLFYSFLACHDVLQVAIRAKLEKQREEKRRALAAAAAGETGENKKPSALDRFKRAK